jgi:23S rRNA pseudouridine2605 synthase
MIQHTSQRLQKALATTGLGSRREIERWIQAKRITINGSVASLGDKVTRNDRITLDGRLLGPLKFIEPSAIPKLLVYYKRFGEMCTTQDPQGRPTVFENLPRIYPQRWIMVGRLDYNTLGLLLFTTNGLLSHRLLHPSYEIEREYIARLHGNVTPDIIAQLKKGVQLDGQIAHFSSVWQRTSAGGSNHWYHVVLKEGRQREVRRLWASQGVTVSRLIRVRFGPIHLPSDMKPGQFIELPDNVCNQLGSCVDL